MLIEVLDGVFQLVDDSLTEGRLLVHQLHQRLVVLHKVVVLLLKVLQLTAALALQLTNATLRLGLGRVKVSLELLQVLVGVRLELGILLAEFLCWRVNKDN